MSIDTRVFGDPATCYTCADSLAAVAAGVNRQLASARAGRTESEHEFIGTTGDEFRRRLDSIISGTTEVADQTDAIATALRLSPDQAGIFLGGTIHDVAQVVGAGYSLSQHTGEVATYVKLLRVALLLPVALILGVLWGGRGRAGAETTRGRLPLPLFLLGFAALVAAGSLGALPPLAIEGASVVSRWCLVAAVAATRFAA